MSSRRASFRLGLGEVDLVFQIDHVALHEVAAIRRNVGDDRTLADGVPPLDRAREYVFGLNLRESFRDLLLNFCQLGILSRRAACRERRQDEQHAAANSLFHNPHRFALPLRINRRHLARYDLRTECGFRQPYRPDAAEGLEEHTYQDRALCPNVTDRGPRRNLHMCSARRDT